MRCTCSPIALLQSTTGHPRCLACCSASPVAVAHLLRYRFLDLNALWPSLPPCLSRLLGSKPRKVSCTAVFLFSLVLLPPVSSCRSTSNPPTAKRCRLLPASPAIFEAASSVARPPTSQPYKAWLERQRSWRGMRVPCLWLFSWAAFFCFLIAFVTAKSVAHATNTSCCSKD